ncbi:glycine oxidase ThiO [Chelatococcus composti]|nr:glycine oxidase ThiO [Chelatococcus composti]MBS7737125.1 glycine oxidase ThiO [Chelatococcus composti]PZN45360.1 MAG: glycine oxidase ThiO [Pseudomonadota bacterium]
MSAEASSRPDRAIIVGGGVMGLSIAWRLAARGIDVTLFEAGRCGTGASHAAAGMLAACAEVEPGEEPLVPLNRASQALWPDFARELEAASGLAVDLRTEGTLVCAFSADDQARLKHHLALQQRLGLPVSWLEAAEVRRREPFLSPGLVGGLWSPEDHQVDNRKLAAALYVAAGRAGATIHEDSPVESIVVEGGRARGVVVRGQRTDADVVVLAAGAWSRRIGGLPRAALPPVRPVKGQLVAVQMDPAAPLLSHVTWVPGAYLVPRRDGRLIIGATVEEKGFDTRMTAGGVLALLDAAWRALPAIEELPIVETWAGLRPGSRDDAPILGPGEIDGLVYATGHHRNGILLTPITSAVIADQILTGQLAEVARPFTFTRFASSADATREVAS